MPDRRSEVPSSPLLFWSVFLDSSLRILCPKENCYGGQYHWSRRPRHPLPGRIPKRHKARHPSGITSVTTSQPIAKVGYLATPPGELFTIDITTESRLGERRPTRVSGSLFLVDGLLVPGNSGSPLVLPSELKVRRAPDSNQLQFATEQTKN